MIDFMHRVALALDELADLAIKATEPDYLTSEDWWISALLIPSGLLIIAFSDRLVRWAERVRTSAFMRRLNRLMGTWDEKNDRPINSMPCITLQVEVWQLRFLGVMVLLFGLGFLLKVLSDIE